MRTKLNLALLLALSVGALGEFAVAQAAMEQAPTPKAEYAVFRPDSSNAALQLVAERDRDRCDGDHDRDDRGCGWRDRDRVARWRNRNNGNWNNGYYGNSPYYGTTANGGYYSYPNRQNGWYDRNGNFHANGSNGYYDRNGNWHRDSWWR